jgi:hypothetical protein
MRLSFNKSESFMRENTNLYDAMMIMYKRTTKKGFPYDYYYYSSYVHVNKCADHIPYL